MNSRIQLILKRLIDILLSFIGLVLLTYALCHHRPGYQAQFQGLSLLPAGTGGEGWAIIQGVEVSHDGCGGRTE